MKKYLSRLLTLAVIVPTVVSCMEQLQDTRTQAKKHTVYFSTVVDGQATKTSLSIENGIVTPDWRVTAPEDVHFFEMNGTENAHLGEASVITPYDNNLGAHFKADFEEEITIIVTPPSDPDPESDGAKVLRQGSNTYGAVVAKSKEVNGDPVFYIPAVQTPSAATLKDPGAEFLVGYSRDGYDAATIDEEGTVVDLYFDRVAALSRIGFTNFQGTDEKVKSVTINSQNSLTGSVKASDITFGNPNSVSTWTPDDESALTLSYGEEGVSVDGPFYAYFVSMPGTFKINSIIVETDQYRYTKAYADGKNLTFDLTKLANLSMDLSTAVAEEIGPDQSGPYYVLVTSEPASWNGTYLIVNTAVDGTGYAMNGASTAEVTISGGKILSDETTDSYALTVTSAGEVHPNQLDGESSLIAYDITFSDGNYLYKYGNTYKQTSETTTSNGRTRHNKCTLLYDNENDGVRVVSAGYSVDVNGNALSSVPSKNFLHYSSQQYAMDSGTDYASARVQLYMLVDDRQVQNLSFDPTTATYDLYTPASFVMPTLSTPVYGDVTYSSSDATIAEVDNAGNITGHKIGTVTITATAAGNAHYKPGTASYTLTVVNNDPNVKVYRKVTATTDLEVGAEYLLVFEGLAGDTDGDGNPKVFKPIRDPDNPTTRFQKHKDNALDVDIVSSEITSSEYEECHLTLETGYYLKVDKFGNYLYPGSETTSSSYGGSTTYYYLFAESSATNAVSIAFDNKGIAQIAIGSKYLVWSTSSHYFSCNNSVSGQYSTGICLYKLDDGRAKQTLNFNPTAATYDLYAPTSFVKPTLSTAHGTVTYSSSDETVATVDNYSGNITGKKKGFVTITATAAGNTQYKPGSASYELEVIDTTPVTPTGTTYKKVTSTASIISGKPYVIVYENGNSSKAFKPILNDAGIEYVASTQNAIDASVSDGIMEGDEEVDGCQIVLEADGTSYKFKIGNKYLYLGNGKIQVDADNSRKHIITISSSGIATFKRDGGTSSGYNYYLAYSDGYFHQASNDSGNLALYMLDDGSNPGGGDDSGDDQTQTTYTQITSVSDLTDGASYLIVSGLAKASSSSSVVSSYAHKYIFKGVDDGSVVEVSPAAANGVITGDYSDYEFVLTKKDNNNNTYSIKGKNGYLYWRENNSTNSRYIGISDSDSNSNLRLDPEHNKASGNEKAFFFGALKSGSLSEFLYLNTDEKFKIGGSGSSCGIYLYKKN